MDFKAKWICASEIGENVVPEFRKRFSVKGDVKKAVLTVTALGVYEAELNGKRIGEYVLAPGWTVYGKRIQYQSYDVTALLNKDNVLTARVGRGWYASHMGFNEEQRERVGKAKRSLLAELHIFLKDGQEIVVKTDTSWEWAESKVRFSEIYDGENYDASFEPEQWQKVKTVRFGTDILIPQEGEEIREQERVSAKKVFRTPAGEIMVDFGQEVTGYVEFALDAKKGDEVRILHSEVLDQQGNFYNENYRSAKAEINYICTDGPQTYHPHLTFFGFRQIKLDKWPQAFEEIRPEQFTAIAVYSAIRRTGHVASSNAKLNQFFSNVFWGQRGNFLDVPTDCPQRDERLGWTGDAQAFCRAASYNFDVKKFFTKWLHDVALDQYENGAVPHVVPDLLKNNDGSAAWGDVACIAPWTIYMTYGDKKVLKDQFNSMKEWVRYQEETSAKPYLWTGKGHFGDWLGLDAPVGSYKGSSREDFIASAFRAYSTALLIKAGHVIGKNVKKYEEDYEKVIEAFRAEYPEYLTQTECVVAIRFDLAEDKQKTADRLAAMIEKAGRMETGFVGTPYLLHVLSDYGYADLAYRLMLRESYPSWIYPVTKGATTVWEHWDGIMEDGSFWSKDMNSFNHYAYGAAIDWIYEKAAGIQPSEPGFGKVKVAPIPTDRLDWLEASIDTVHGKVYSKWSHAEGGIRYDITLPTAGEVVIAGEKKELPAGSYVFFG